MNEDHEAIDRVLQEAIASSNRNYNEVEVQRRLLVLEAMKVVELRRLNDRLEAIFEMMSAADDRWRGREG